MAPCLALPARSVGGPEGDAQLPRDLVPALLGPRKLPGRRAVGARRHPLTPNWHKEKEGSREPLQPPRFEEEEAESQAIASGQWHSRDLSQGCLPPFRILPASPVVSWLEGSAGAPAGRWVLTAQQKGGGTPLQRSQGPGADGSTREGTQTDRGLTAGGEQGPEPIGCLSRGGPGRAVLAPSRTWHQRAELGVVGRAW